MTTLPDRFWSKVDKTDTCWVWTAYTNAAGYGRFMYNRRAQFAHRLAYMDAKGDIPDGLELDHLCRNRACLNPDHLEAVTRKVNVQRGLVPQIASDLITKYNHSRADRTHCARGHEYTSENTSILTAADGYERRYCLDCARVRRQKVA